MFVPALCLGMTLPLASRVATSELSRTGRSVGLVFSVNTIGTVLGAALTGLVLLPALGLAETFALGAGVNLVIAIAVLVRRHRWARTLTVWASPLVVLALVVIVHLGLSLDWNRAFALGLWRLGSPPSNLASYLDLMRSVDLRYHRDGAGSTVVVHSWTNPISHDVELTLRVNGKADATTRGDLPTQLLTGHIPVLLKPVVKDVMVVGIGSGMTCGAILTHPGIEHLDAVEISPEVRDAARTLFAPYNNKALDDPRVRVVLDDAKSFLRTSSQSYDLIVSEPSNPWMAGVAGVFSLEYYEACRGSLRPGGLMAQWVQIYESDDETLRTVFATFTSVFPFTSIWQSLPGDLMLIGSAEPLSRDLEGMQQRFNDPQVTADIRRADIFTFPVLLGLQIVSDSNTAFIPTDETARHSDYFPTLEYMAGRGFFARDRARLFEVFDENSLRRPGTLLGDYLKKHELTKADLQSFALFHTSFGLPRPHILRSLLEKWRNAAPDETLPVEYSAKLDYPLPVAELEASRMARVRDLMMTNAPTDPEPLRLYSRHLMYAYRYLRSAYYQPPSEELTAVLTRLAETDARHRQSHLLRLAEIAWDNSDDARFFELASASFLQNQGAPAVGRFDLDTQGPGRILFLVIETLWRAGKFQDAQAWCDAARSAGYLSPASPYFSERLAMVVRKMETSNMPASSGAQPATH
jgi:spermidine synthase